MSLPQHWTLHNGDALSVLRTLPDASVNCCVTSPPYFNLRDYGHEEQIGMEESPAAFVAALVSVFAEVRRVLRDDGVLWMNLGDSYAGSWGAQSREHAGKHAPNVSAISANQVRAAGRRLSGTGSIPADSGLKPKDLIGVPWMAAFALRADGWFLRSDVVWHKPNPMPESIQDRPTKAHEMVFLLSKSARYWYDADAIREKYALSTLKQFEQPYDGEATKDYGAAGVQNPSGVKARIVAKARDKQSQHGNRRYSGFNDRWDESVAEYAGKHAGADPQSAGRRMLANVKAARDAGADHDNPFGGANARSVWTIPTEPSPYEHFAVMPKALARRCIIAGCPAGGVVLDPFAGMATTGVVALEEGRSFVGIELNPKYHAAARERLAGVAPLLATEVAS